MHVMRTGQLLLQEWLTDADLVAASRGPEHLELLRALGLRSRVTAPLVARQRTLGTISLVYSDSGRRLGAGHAPPLRILLVEDHGDTLRLMARLLERQRHRITQAAGVSAALDAAETDRFDLVISDVGLPDGSGLHLMEHLRRQCDLPGIALSGFGMEDDVRRSIEAGFVEHLTKPIDVEALQAAIGRVGRAAAQPAP